MATSRSTYLATLARGDFGGLAIEHNCRFSEDGVPTASAEPLGAMPFASELSTALSEVNQSGRIHIAWEAALPDTIADLLRSQGLLPISTRLPSIPMAMSWAFSQPSPSRDAEGDLRQYKPRCAPPIRLRWRQRTSHGAQGDSSSDATSVH